MSLNITETTIRMEDKRRRSKYDDKLAFLWKNYNFCFGITYNFRNTYYPKSV